MVARQSGMPRSNLRRGAATEVDKLDSFDDSFDTDKVAGTARPDMDSREAKLAARFARGAHTTASVAIAKAAEATQARTSTLNELNEGVTTQTYTTRVTLKMRADADMKSDPAGEMSANTHVHVSEWRVLADGTRRAHVCEVGSSPEKSGWLSCVAKDGAETFLPTTVPTSQFKARAMSRRQVSLKQAGSAASIEPHDQATPREGALRDAFAEDPRLQGPNGEVRERRVRI